MNLGPNDGVPHVNMTVSILLFLAENFVRFQEMMQKCGVGDSKLFYDHKFITQASTYDIPGMFCFLFA